MAASAPAQVITTVAGGGPTNGPALQSPIGWPLQVALDSSGNRYIATGLLRMVVKISPGGNLTVVAGTGADDANGDGLPATSASLRYPSGVAVATNGDIYIADAFAYTVRKVTFATGLISTIAGTSGIWGNTGDGGPATAARLDGPNHLALHGGFLYIADTNNHRVRRVDLSGGNIFAFAGNGLTGPPLGDGGVASAAHLNYPNGVAADASGNIYIADTANQRVRVVSGGTINTLAGTGTAGWNGDGITASTAQLNNPEGVFADASGVYIADEYNFMIRRVAGGIITRVAGGSSGFGGDGGDPLLAAMQRPWSAVRDGSGNLHIGDTFNSRLRVVSGAVIDTVAGNGTTRYGGDSGPATGAIVSHPRGLAIDASGNFFIADEGNSRVRRVDGATGQMTTVAGTGINSYNGDGIPAVTAALRQPHAVALDAAGNLYIADTFSHRIRRVSAGTGTITTVAGNGTLGNTGDSGPATSAQLNTPQGVVWDAPNFLYIADTGNHRVRRVNLGTNTITAFAGTGSAGLSGDGLAATSASLNSPSGLAADGTGNLFIADSNNHRIRRVSAGIIDTVAGTTAGFAGDGGPAVLARLISPVAVAVDGDGNMVIADTNNQRIRLVEARTGRITTVAGAGALGFFGDLGPALNAKLNYPRGIALDSQKRVLLADYENNRVRAVPLGLDLVITKDDSQTSEVPGTTVTYVVRVTNAGTLTVSSVNVAEILPPALSGVAYLPSSGLYTPGTGDWTGLALGPTQFVTLAVSGSIASGATGFLSNTAQVAPPLGLLDPTPPNQATDVDSLLPEADVSILKTDSPDPATVGMPLNYTLNVFNNGPSDATNVSVTDTLPPGVTFVSATPPCSWSGVVTCALGTIASGSGHPPLTITVMPTQPGTLVNTATVAHGETDPDGSNDTAVATTVVVATRATGLMAVGRAGHTTTLLHNGKILVAGGEVGPAAYTATTELYDPATGLWSPSGPLGTPRAWHTATLLPNGKVLVAGGYNGATGTLLTAELYDPVSDTWVPTGTLGTDRMHHAATLLGDGTVLVTGGWSATFGMLGSVERYNPPSGTWAIALGMGAARQEHTATRLSNGKVLVAGGIGRSDSEIFDPGSGWSPTVGPLNQVRGRHSATLLPNGQVLVTGGNGGDSTAEIFDPGSGTWTPTANMSGFRTAHSATLLPNGKVLVAGSNTVAANGTSEIYDPVGVTWSPGPGLVARRASHGATLLPDGRVLFSGGYDSSAAAYLASAELFSVTGTFSATGSLSIPRFSHTTTLLPNGKVLAVGDGAFDSAPTDLYDFGTGLWTPTPSGLLQGRHDHTATLLVNGKVLVAGGFGAGMHLDKAELFDSFSQSWTATSDLALARSRHTSTLLPDGTVLVIGGYDGGSCVGQPERYRPLSATWELLPAMPICRFDHAAVLLPNGKVLVIGGTDLTFSPFATTEIYDPGSGTWTPQGNLIMPRRRPAATLLPDGRVLVVSGTDASSLAEIYDSGSGSWSSAGNMTAPRLDASATLLPGGQVLVAGGSASVVYRKTAEVFDPATSSWTPAGDMAQTRASHTAVFLPNGRVLVTGGTDGSPPGRSGSELYDPGLGYLAGWQPVLFGAAPDPVVDADRLTASGMRFRGVSEASGGQGAQDSSTDYPLVQLRRLDNSAVRWLSVDPTLGFSDNSFRSLPLSGLVPGEALVTVFTNGIPAISRTVTVECPAATFSGTPGDQSVCAGSTVQFTVAVTGAFPEFQWRKDGSPLSDGGRITGARTDTLRITNVDPSDNGMYDVVVSLACSSVAAISVPPATLTVEAPLTMVSASPPGPWNVCQYTGCTGAPLFESHVGGGAVTHQWGFRTSPGGPVTDIPGATGVSYTIRGTDFPGPGTYYVVVTTASTCGTPLTSNNVVVTVDTSGVADTVRYLTVTSRDGQNVVQWLNPMAFGNVRVRYKSDPASCAFPTDPDGSDGSGGPFDVAGTPDQPARFEHNGLTNGNSYCYTAWVDTGTWSAGKNVKGRPFTVSAGPGAKWGFNMGIWSMVPPGNGVGVVYSVANDGALHAMVKGSGAQAGTWPGPLASLPVWKPQSMNGPSQGRPSGIPVPTTGSTRTIFLSSQDGHVYAFNADTGAPGWTPSSPLLAPSPHLQAHPAGVFTMFGGTRDLIFVGTRDPAGSRFYALRLLDGNMVAPGWEFDGGGFGRIGAINGQAAVDQAARRVYFGSREFDPVENKTVWCLDLETGVPCAAFPPQAYGNVDTGVSLAGTRLFVGTNDGAGTDPRVRAIRTSDGLEDWFYPITPATEGAPKGFVTVDRLTGNVYFSTATTVWALNAGGGLDWSCPALTSPSVPLFAPGDLFVYVGAGDGKLHRLRVSGGAEDTTAPFPVPLGDGSAGVGSPTYDLPAGFMYAGTEDGIVYAIQLP